MATPSFVAVQTGSRESNATSSSIAAPTASTGDLLLALFSTDGAGNPTLSTASTGWTKLGQVTAASQATLAVFAGIQGTAAALTITSTTSAHGAWLMASFSNWSNDVADIEIATFPGGDTSTQDCPALTPAHGEQDYMWVTGVAIDHARAISTAPSGFTGLTNVRCSTLTADIHTSIGYAYMGTTATTTLDPGNFTSAASGDWVTVTVSIPPLLAEPVEFEPDDVHLAEQPSRISLAFAGDAIHASESASVAADVPSASDHLALDETLSVVSVVPPAESLVIDEGISSLTVTVSDDIYIEDGSERVIPPPVSDMITMTESAMVTNLVTPAPDSLTFAELPAEVIEVKYVTDAISLAEVIDSLSSDMAVQDTIDLAESADPMSLAVTDGMTLTDRGFAYGDGLRVRGARVNRIQGETRTYRIPPRGRTHRISAERRILKVR